MLRRGPRRRRRVRRRPGDRSRRAARRLPRARSRRGCGPERRRAPARSRPCEARCRRCGREARHARPPMPRPARRVRLGRRPGGLRWRGRAPRRRTGRPRSLVGLVPAASMGRRPARGLAIRSSASAWMLARADWRSCSAWARAARRGPARRPCCRPRRGCARSRPRQQRRVPAPAPARERRWPAPRRGRSRAARRPLPARGQSRPWRR